MRTTSGNVRSASVCSSTERPRMPGSRISAATSSPRCTRSRTVISPVMASPPPCSTKLASASKRLLTSTGSNTRPRLLQPTSNSWRTVFSGLPSAMGKGCICASVTLRDFASAWSGRMIANTDAGWRCSTRMPRTAARL
ncbi:hypothetical protein D9M72_348740 [compost metagenome]